MPLPIASPHLSPATMERTPILPPTVAYYIRKLLRQNIDQLKSVLAKGAGMTADPMSDLDVVLDSLYLEEGRIKEVAQQLETLALSHQALTAQGNRYRREVQSHEEKIFWLLGFKYQKPPRQGKILVVDDTADSSQLLARSLGREGYEVQVARSGREALDQLLAFTPDLIFLDVVMPGLSGFEVCQELKKSHRHNRIPLIFISAIGEVEQKVKAFELGATDYITKPFHTDEVLIRTAYQIELVNMRKRLEEQNVRLQSEIQERQQVEEQYRSIFDNAVDGMFQSTPEGHYMRVNHALAQIYGYPDAQTLLTELTDIKTQLYVDPGCRQSFQLQIADRDAIANFEAQVRRRDGSILWISENVRRVKDPLGRTLYYEGIVRRI
ncbi:MAG: response regulator [Cyanobacteria bacterium P01_A01_bin.105]